MICPGPVLFLTSHFHGSGRTVSTYGPAEAGLGLGRQQASEGTETWTFPAVIRSHSVCDRPYNDQHCSSQRSARVNRPAEAHKLDS